jgi:hypothetical protein
MMTRSIQNLSLALCLSAAGLNAATIVNWADWTSGSPGANGTATGSFQFGVNTVGLTYTGQIEFLITGGGTNYWTEPNSAARPYTGGDVTNAPPASDIIAMSASGSRTLTFTQAVTDLYFAYVSLNGNGFVFNQDFEIISQGQGYWGNGTAVKQNLGPGQFGLTGTSGEPHGLIRFVGSFDSITWSSNANENWYGFTVGAFAPADTSIPEPSTFILGASGLFLAAALRKRRQRCR